MVNFVDFLLLQKRRRILLVQKQIVVKRGGIRENIGDIVHFPDVFKNLDILHLVLDVHVEMLGVELVVALHFPQQFILVSFYLLYFDLDVSLESLVEFPAFFGVDGLVLYFDLWVVVRCLPQHSFHPDSVFELLILPVRHRRPQIEYLIS